MTSSSRSVSSCAGGRPMAESPSLSSVLPIWFSRFGFANVMTAAILSTPGWRDLEAVGYVAGRGRRGKDSSWGARQQGRKCDPCRSDAGGQHAHIDPEVIGQLADHLPTEGFLARQ